MHGLGIYGSMERNLNDRHMFSKAELTHPVYACVNRSAFHFLGNYIGWLNQGKY